MDSIPQSPDSNTPSPGDSVETRGQSMPTYVPREVPEFARRFASSLRRRDWLHEQANAGGSYAARHLSETGHEFERGCCAKPENRCPVCRKVLPRIAKVKGERYCSRSCREASSSA